MELDKLSNYFRKLKKNIFVFEWLVEMYVLDMYFLIDVRNNTQ